MSAGRDAKTAVPFAQSPEANAIVAGPPATADSISSSICTEVPSSELQALHPISNGSSTDESHFSPQAQRIELLLGGEAMRLRAARRAAACGKKQAYAQYHPDLLDEDNASLIRGLLGVHGPLTEAKLTKALRHTFSCRSRACPTPICQRLRAKRAFKEVAKLILALLAEVEKGYSIYAFVYTAPKSPEASLQALVDGQRDNFTKLTKSRSWAKHVKAHLWSTEVRFPRQPHHNGYILARTRPHWIREVRLAAIDVDGRAAAAPHQGFWASELKTKTDVIEWSRYITKSHVDNGLLTLTEDEMREALLVIDAKRHGRGLGGLWFGAKGRLFPPPPKASKRPRSRGNPDATTDEIVAQDFEHAAPQVLVDERGIRWRRTSLIISDADEPEVRLPRDGPVGVLARAAWRGARNGH